MKSVDYLVEYAKAQVGRPYWMGTYGQIADSALLAYKRNQYPQGYPDPGYPAFKNQLGKKVHDCNGLVYAASVCDTPDSKPNGYPDPYYGVSKLYNKCDNKGPVTSSTILVKGELLFRNNYGHVGIYGGDGYVYHAKGHAWGVVKEAYNYKDWLSHGQFSEMYIYHNELIMTIRQPTVLYKGCKGREVKDWQSLLLAAGYPLPLYGADGDFGTETESATIMYQQDCKLAADGIVDVATWKERLNNL